jgi:hypothetical protein
MPASPNDVNVIVDDPDDKLITLARKVVTLYTQDKDFIQQIHNN